MKTFIVNGEEHAPEVDNLAQLLVALEYEGSWLATAVNGELVHASKRQSFILSDGDKIEILSPMQGG